MSELVYLACPYSDLDPEVREDRFRRSCYAAAGMMKAGWCVFSPIAHSHPIEKIGMDEKPEHDFWMRQDIAILRHCQRLVVLKLAGWERSKGVQQEIELAQMLGIQIDYLDPEAIG